MKNEHWKQQNERGTLLGMRILLLVYRLFGSRVCKGMLYPVLVYFYWSNKKLRLALQTYYQHVRNHQQNHRPSQSIVAIRPFLNVRYFGFGIVDRLALWHGRIDVNKSIKAHNSEVLYHYAEQSQKGGIILSSHLGNFDLCRGAGKQRFKAKVNVIVDIENAKKINQILSLVNQEYLVDFIAVNEINISLAIQLKEKIDAGEFIVIAGDRVNDEQFSNSVEVPFLGQPAKFPIGPYVLAKVLECPIFTLYCFANKKGHYDVYFEQLFTSVDFSKADKKAKIHHYASLYAADLEKQCLQYPEQWFNFYNFWK